MAWDRPTDRVRNGIALVLGLAVACPSAGAAQLSVPKALAALDSITAPPCQVMARAADQGWASFRPEAEVRFSLPFKLRSGRENEHPGRHVRSWLREASDDEIMLIRGTTEGMLMDAWPLAVLLEQYERSGRGIPEHCSHCTQPVRMCSATISGRRAWITSGREEGSNYHTDTAILQLRPGEWIALSVHTKAEVDPQRSGILHSLELLP